MFKSNVLVFFVLLMFGGCATTQFMPLPNQENQVIPNTSKLTSQKGELIINIGPVSSPYKLNNKLTTIEMTLINPTGSNLTFYPKEFLLFDQSNRQYYPLEQQALSEVALSSWNPYPRSSLGFWYYHGYRPYHYSYGFHPYPYYHSYGRSYRELNTKALPLRPITIHPNSSVSGYLYYPVSRNELRSITLVITRFTQQPTGPEDTPPEIAYRFEFDALK